MRSSQIARMLPVVYQRALSTSPLLRGFLDSMEGLHENTERLFSGLETTFDARRCPPQFVPMLAEWTAWNINISTGIGRYREVVASAVALSQWRGTQRQLLTLLTIATGTTGVVIAEGVDARGIPKPFHIVVSLDETAAIHARMISAIIESEKPAHVTYELLFRATPESPPGRVTGGVIVAS